MTTFDASTTTSGQLPVSGSDPASQANGSAPATPVENAVPELGTMLDSLQNQLETREIDDTTTVEVPGMPLRLVCTIDFPYNKFAQWQKAALPRGQRNGRKTNMFDLDRCLLSIFVLLGTCQGMEYRTSSGEWLPMTKPDGSPLRPDSSEFLARFNQVDARSFLRTLFGGEAGVTRAGEAVTRAAGWTEDSVDDDGDDDGPLG